MNGAPLALAALAIAGLTLDARLADRARPDLTIPAGMGKTQQEKLEQVAGASLFGQFRSNMADFLWMKVDKYLHSGVDLRGLTKEERAQSVATVQNGKGGEKDGNRAHVEETTIVLSKQSDWRGFLGNVERDVKPYMDMTQHNHRDPKEALPLFRLMTWSNPHFVQGYATGAVMIAREKKAYDEALAFIAEGEKNNPESVEIQSTFAFLLLRGRFDGKADFDEAARHAESAIQLAHSHDRAAMSVDEQEAWQDAVRWRVLSLRDGGKLAEAREAAREGLRDFPEDVTCRKFLGGK